MDLLKTTKRIKHVQLNITKNMHVTHDADIVEKYGVQPYIILDGLPDDHASSEDIKKYRIFIDLQEAEKIYKCVKYLKSKAGMKELVDNTYEKNNIKI